MPDYFVKTKWFEGKKYKARGKTEKEAVEKLAEKIAAAKRGENTINASMTVNAWYKEWMTTYKKPKDMTAKSLGMYDEKYNKYIKPRIGTMRLKDVKDVHLQRILNEQAGMSESHVKKVRSVMQQMFKRARQSRLIMFDPAELLELPKYSKAQRRSITEEERTQILKLAETHRGGLWVLTLLYTGMRPAETVALKWSDIDFDKKEIHVRAAKESGTHNKIKAPKTEAGKRIIPIHAKLLPLLEAAPKSPTGRVFVNKAGNPHNEYSLRRLWENFKRELDIQMGATLYRSEIIKSVLADDLVPYCLRHTFCTDLQAAGVPLNIAKELMGHADIQTTANIYTHRDENLLHSSMELLDGTAAKKSANGAKLGATGTSVTT